MSRKHMGAGLIGVANKNTEFVTLVGLINDLKHNEASFSSCSRVAQMPRSPDLAILY